MEKSRTRGKNDLDFKPITAGLGFHPFADGLPYAPVNPSTAAARVSSGSGAIAAGPTRFATPSKPGQMPRVSVPVARTAMPQVQSPVQNQTQTQAQALAHQQALGFQFEETAPGVVYLFKRLFAYFADCVLNIGLCTGALALVLWKQNLNPQMLFNPGIIVVSVLFLAVFNWAMIAAQEVAFGTSAGKRLFGLALRGTTSAIFLRAFFFLPSLGFAGLGVLWAVLDPRRRCWHDLVVDLQPIEIARI